MSYNPPRVSRNGSRSNRATRMPDTASQAPAPGTPAPTNYDTPQQTAAVAVAAGTAKAALTPGNALVGGFLGGAYIASAACSLSSGRPASIRSSGADRSRW